MATTTGQKTLCSTCQKAAGILTCRGCGKDFCYRHVTEHRQELNKQMDELTTNHDQLQQTIADQTLQPNCHPLMTQIDAWEQQSIDKIHQAANDARKQILNIVGTYRTHVTTNLAHLTNELNKARNEDDYVETDLKAWKEKLDELQTNLTAAEIINFNHDNNETSLIPKIFINDASTDSFSQTKGNIQISEDGKVVIHGVPDEIAEARCRGEYSLGQHRFHFQIGTLSSQYGFSCGIVSKTTPVGSIFNPPSFRNMHVYSYDGSGTYNPLNHNVVFFFSAQSYPFQSNNTYELLLDCNRKMMCLKNEQSGFTAECNIDVTKCPFPWQFFITLLHANESVRFC
jgi:hypothetical protein